jgi:hypothetical protein
MVQFFRNQGQRLNRFFTQKFIEYQISIRIPFSLKKNEKLHIWFSLFNFLSECRMSSKNNCSVQSMCFHKKGEGFLLKNLVIFQTVDNKAIKTYPNVKKI